MTLPAVENTNRSQCLIEDSIIASALVLCFNATYEEKISGEYRAHMNAVRLLLAIQKPKNEKLRQFATEFIRYYTLSDPITSLSGLPLKLIDGGVYVADINPRAIGQGIFLGIFDGLFNLDGWNTHLRDKIRHRLNEGYERAIRNGAFLSKDAPPLNSSTLRVLELRYLPDCPNWVAGQLYWQSTWIYLYRTIRVPSRSSDELSERVNGALRCLDSLPLNAGAYAFMLTPVFLLGCFAFESRQRQRIKRALEDMVSCHSRRNIEICLKVLVRVWEVMDTSEEVVWDWEKIMLEVT